MSADLGEVAHNVEALAVILRHDIEEEGVRVIVQCLVIEETLGQKTQILGVTLQKKRPVTPLENFSVLCSGQMGDKHHFLGPGPLRQSGLPCYLGRATGCPGACVLAPCWHLTTCLSGKLDRFPLLPVAPAPKLGLGPPLHPAILNTCQ